MATLKPAAQMQKIITEIAAKFGLDLTANEAALKLQLGGYQPLVIEKIGVNRVSVAHYRIENGDAIADPDMEFFINANGEWMPQAITQVLGGYQRALYFNESGDKITQFSPYQYRSQVSFSTLWARNIKAQGWLKADVVYVKNPAQ